MPGTYKKDDEGREVFENGNPVYVREDGTETIVDFENLVQTVNSTNSESKARKEKIKELEKAAGKFKDFEGTSIEDMKKAMEIMANLEGKELVKAGERDEAINQAVENTKSKYEPQLKSYEQRLSELTAANSQKDGLINAQVINQTLSNSPFLDKVSNTTPDVRQAIFGSHFRVEQVNGHLKAVAYKADGEKLYSPANPAQLCEPEEALQILWNNYPWKDTYSKLGLQGSGSTGNAGGGVTNTYTRLEWQQELAKATLPEKKALFESFSSGKIKIK